MCGGTTEMAVEDTPAPAAPQMGPQPLNEKLVSLSVQVPPMSAVL